MHRFDDFQDRNVLITGAADGIGAALAEALVAEGARVFAGDIDEEKLKSTAARIGAASAVCDVSDAEAVEDLVDRAWSELGPIDLLCANAGVFVPGSLLDASQAEIDFILGVNVWGVVNTCRSYARRLRADGREGYMLLTGSEHSLSNPEYLRRAPMHLYNLSKHAVLSIGESMRAELGPEGVGVSVLCPGPVVSGLLENSTRIRPVEAGETKSPDFSEVDAEAMSKIGDLYMPASKAAEIALRGLRVGAFIIPTHPFEQADVDARHVEALAGFELLD